MMLVMWLALLTMARASGLLRAAARMHYPRLVEATKSLERPFGAIVADYLRKEVSEGSRVYGSRRHAFGPEEEARVTRFDYSLYMEVYVQCVNEPMSHSFAYVIKSSRKTGTKVKSPWAHLVWKWVSLRLSHQQL